MSRMPVKQTKQRTVSSRSTPSPALKRESCITSPVANEDAVDTEASRPQGALSVTEIDRLRAAYRAGATGHLLVGLRQQTRLLTVMIPVQDNQALMAHKMERYAARLRALRCDGYIHVRRIRLRRSAQEAMTAMLIDQSLLRQHRQQFVVLDTGSPASGWLQDNPIQDAVSHALRRAFDSE